MSAQPLHAAHRFPTPWHQGRRDRLPERPNDFFAGRSGDEMIEIHRVPSVYSRSHSQHSLSLLLFKILVHKKPCQYVANICMFSWLAIVRTAVASHIFVEGGSTGMLS
jgi:hypothetical protein